MDELNEQGGVTPEDAEALKELAEEFDLDSNELDIQIKKQDTPVKQNDAGNADNQSIQSDENMITRYANQYGLESDSLGVSDGQGGRAKSGKDVRVSVDDAALKHSTEGDFTYNPKNGQVSRMKGGGHGQSNIDFLKKNGIEYNIEKVYENGVRVGNVPKHKTPSKRIGTGQAWFPETWSDSKIKVAGEFVANLPENRNLPDGVIGYGEYDGVRVGVIKTNGKVGTIFPDADLQP